MKAKVEPGEGEIDKRVSELFKNGSVCLLSPLSLNSLAFLVSRMFVCLNCSACENPASLQRGGGSGLVPAQMVAHLMECSKEHWAVGQGWMGRLSSMERGVMVWMGLGGDGPSTGWGPAAFANGHYRKMWDCLPMVGATKPKTPSTGRAAPGWVPNPYLDGRVTPKAKRNRTHTAGLTIYAGFGHTGDTCVRVLKKCKSTPKIFLTSA